ncbi:uncharacterized protein LOC129595163 [Paramacrobiotus metropolitanus]|uniref:uncharacterized protein LOC129595163 n=1 Tax=Paramacrobiotus metropolitanus TaxID=2943436 RepID=UPI0024456335|nr:uncharacterized protein LOC129595163 [Paramacrobiotus metropolitanus]
MERPTPYRPPLSPQPRAPTLPTTTSAPRNPLTCSFAENLCGWTTETTDTFQWQRVNTVPASPQNINAPPDTDGWFLFAQGTEFDHGRSRASGIQFNHTPCTDGSALLRVRHAGGRRWNLC